MNISLCIDVEATCFEGCTVEGMECIEIGVIAIDQKGKELSRFQSYINPQHSDLNEFCTEITGITADMLEGAPKLEEATKLLNEWLKSLPSCPTSYFSWGSYDQRQLTQDFKRLNIIDPLPKHYDAKKMFQKKNLRGGKRVGMRKALELMGMTFDGQPHRAIDDAYNLSRLYSHFFS